MIIFYHFVTALFVFEMYVSFFHWVQASYCRWLFKASCSFGQWSIFKVYHIKVKWQKDRRELIKSNFGSCSFAKSCPTPGTALCLTSLSFTVSWDLLRFMSIQSVMPSNHLIFCLLHLLPSVFPSISVFSKRQLFTSYLSFYNVFPWYLQFLEEISSPSHCIVVLFFPFFFFHLRVISCLS